MKLKAASVYTVRTPLKYNQLPDKVQGEAAMYAELDLGTMGQQDFPPTSEEALTMRSCLYPSIMCYEASTNALFDLTKIRAQAAISRLAGPKDTII